MSLKLYMHPLSSYCHKVLMALYESGTPFEGQLVDLGNAEDRAAFLKVWPVGKFPVLRDTATDQTIPESTSIIEYLALRHPGKAALIPADPDVALEVRARDRFFDIYVHNAMQTIVGDKIRPEGKKDPFGLEQAKDTLRTAYGLIDRAMAGRTWAVGNTVTMADCAAAPALFYANKVLPLTGHPHVEAYHARLLERPSYARVLAEAAPYFAMFPG